MEVMSSSGLRTNPLVLVTDQKISMAQQVTRVVVLDVLVLFLFFVVMIENPSGNVNVKEFLQLRKMVIMKLELFRQEGKT